MAFHPPSGGGGGTIDGSIADNQIAFGAGADEIEGSARLTFNGTDTISYGVEGGVSSFNGVAATSADTVGGGLGLATGAGNGTGGGGAFNLATGNSTSGDGGGFNIETGTGVFGGSFSFQGGAGTTKGGSFFVTGGLGGTGNGGGVDIAAGDSDTTGNGGSFNITAGLGGTVSGNGGDVLITLGATQAGGTEGKLIISPKYGGQKNAILDFDSIATTDKTFTFPNTTGTIALTSDIPAAGADTALSNLASVAINSDLIPATDSTISLGSNTKAWLALFTDSVYSFNDVQEILLGADVIEINGADPGGTGLSASIHVGAGITADTDGDISFTTSGTSAVYIGNGTGDFDLEQTDGIYMLHSGTGAVKGILNFATVATTSKTFTFPNTTGTIDVTASSRRYKTEIESLTNGLSIVERLQPRTFVYKDNGRKAFGLVAEEVEVIDSRLVIYNKENQPDGVYYTELTGILVKAIQELQERIKILESK